MLIIVDKFLKKLVGHILGPDALVNGQFPGAVAFRAFVNQPDIYTGLVGVHAEFFAAIVFHFSVAFAAMPDYDGGGCRHYAPGCCLFIQVNHLDKS